MMKKFLAIGLLTSLLSSSLAFAEQQLVDQAVAIANEDIILASELKQASAVYVRNLQNKGIALPDSATLRRLVLDQLINQSLIMQLAKKSSIELSDTDIDHAIENIAQANRKTVGQVLAEAKQNGYSEASFREFIKENIISQEVKRAQVRNRVNVSDQEVEQLALTIKEQASSQMSYHLANILIKLPEDASPSQIDTASRRAQTIVQAHKSGTSFASLAQRYSEAPNALEGGDLGKNINLNELPSELANAIATHEIGDLVGPLRTQSGIVIIKIYNYDKQKPEPVEQVKVKHVLLTTSIIFDDEHARAQLERYRNAIINGEAKFEDIARTHSQDPYTAINGGAMDWMNPNVFDVRFRNEIALLKPGEISKPFKSSFGWHIAYLEDRKIDTDSLEAYKIKAREMLHMRSLNDEMQKWEQELRDSSYVKILE